MQISRIAKAKTRAWRSQPFFAAVAGHYEFEEVEWLDTIATDAKKVYYNPEFVNNSAMTTDELAFIVCSTICRNAFLHTLRRGSRDKDLWNAASSFVCNQIVHDAGDEGNGFTTPREDVAGPLLLDSRFKGMSVNQVYELLKQEGFDTSKLNFPSMPGDGEGEGSSGGGGQSPPGDQDDESDEGDQDSDGEGSGGGQGQSRENWGGMIPPQSKDRQRLTPVEMKELEDDIRQQVQDAAASAKAVGKLPGNLSGLIKVTGKSKIDWQAYIQAWVKAQNPDDWSWQKPNRRYLATPLYGSTQRIIMPTMKTVGAGFGVLSVDVSRSVSDAELRKYVREISGILDMCKPDRVLIIQHDTSIRAVREWEPHDEFTDLKIRGRGGTNIQPIFDYIEEKIDQPIDWLICFSDMEIWDFPDRAPEDYDVLWCSTGREDKPFGTLVMLRDPLDDL